MSLRVACAACPAAFPRLPDVSSIRREPHTRSVPCRLHGTSVLLGLIPWAPGPSLSKRLPLHCGLLQAAEAPLPLTAGGLCAGGRWGFVRARGWQSLSTDRQSGAATCHLGLFCSLPQRPRWQVSAFIARPSPGQGPPLALLLSGPSVSLCMGTPVSSHPDAGQGRREQTAKGPWCACSTPGTTGLARMEAGVILCQACEASVDQILSGGECRGHGRKPGWDPCRGCRQ